MEVVEVVADDEKHQLFALVAVHGQEQVAWGVDEQEAAVIQNASIVGAY